MRCVRDVVEVFVELVGELAVEADFGDEEADRSV
jgi:hypothetical protein